MSNTGTAQTEPTNRDLGKWGTIARVLLGAGFVVAAFSIGVKWHDAAIGLVAFPVAVMLVIAFRGRSAAPLRLFGSSGHGLNCVIAIAAFVLLLVPALLFYGASMLLAAVRGYGGCELFAASNWLLERDDQIACPVFTPIDAAETRSLHR